MNKIRYLLTNKTPKHPHDWPVIGWEKLLIDLHSIDIYMKNDVYDWKQYDWLDEFDIMDESGAI